MLAVKIQGNAKHNAPPCLRIQDQTSQPQICRWNKVIMIREEISETKTTGENPHRMRERELFLEKR